MDLEDEYDWDAFYSHFPPPSSLIDVLTSISNSTFIDNSYFGDDTGRLNLLSISFDRIVNWLRFGPSLKWSVQPLGLQGDMDTPIESEDETSPSILPTTNPWNKSTDSIPRRRSMSPMSMHYNALRGIQSPVKSTGVADICGNCIIGNINTMGTKSTPVPTESSQAQTVQIADVPFTRTPGASTPISEYAI
jgi:hypothetical protein